MGKSRTDKVRLYVAAYDTHYPKVHWPTFNALLSFLEENQVDGFVWGGDQMDNQEISPYTRGKERLRIKAGTLERNRQGFNERVLSEVERRLQPDAEKIYILGNHDDWEEQYIDASPELEGSVETHKVLDVEARGWKVIECGKHWKKGKLTFIHGDQLAGIGNQIPGSHARKAVESYNSNVLYGHFHAPQTHSRIMPFDQSQKHMAWCAPIVGAKNPGYLRNKPTNWVNGFVIIEFHPDGTFNVYPVVVTNGQFSFGGKLYGSKKKK